MKLVPQMTTMPRAASSSRPVSEVFCMMSFYEADVARRTSHQSGSKRRTSFLA